VIATPPPIVDPGGAQALPRWAETLKIPGPAPRGPWRSTHTSVENCPNLLRGWRTVFENPTAALIERSSRL
jgi:hypothetical protein